MDKYNYRSSSAAQDKREALIREQKKTNIDLERKLRETKQQTNQVTSEQQQAKVKADSMEAMAKNEADYSKQQREKMREGQDLLAQQKNEVRELTRQHDQAEARNQQLESEVQDMRHELGESRTFQNERVE